MDILFGFGFIPAWACPGGVFDLVAVGNWVTAYLTRAVLDGRPIKFVEGINEANVPNSWGLAVMATVQAGQYSASDLSSG